MTKQIYRSLVFDDEEFEKTCRNGVADLTHVAYNKKASKFDMIIISEPIRHEYKEKLILFQNLPCTEFIEKLEELEKNLLSKMFILDLDVYAQSKRNIHKRDANYYYRLFKNTHSLFTNFEINIDDQKVEVSKPQEEEYKDKLIIDDIVF